MVTFKMFILIWALCLLQGAGSSLIKLNNNGFEDVVIAINPDVPEDENLIQQIKTMITDASTFLFEATEKRFYFKNISILIPKKWSEKPEYKAPKLETYADADVLVVQTDLQGKNEPYTKNFKMCGEQGESIHLTNDFVLGKHQTQYGPLGRAFVHEWAHFRWGVFEEYNEAEPFYSSNGKIEATRCSKQLTGLNKVQTCQGGSCSLRNCRREPKTGLYEEHCQFIPEKNQVGKGSIMFMQSIDSVVEFCTEENHNTEAPNRQNRICKGKSTWDVIKGTEDFKNSDPMAMAKPPLPDFSLLQIRRRVVCLVLDKSGSMGYGNRMKRMYQAASLFLQQIIEEGSWAGIVSFDGTASIQSNLVQINHEEQRKELINKLPLTPEGSTSICSGVRKGFEVIRVKYETDGSEIVLLTDGEDNTIGQCVEEVKESKAIIHTISLGPDADMNLQLLSNITGGLNYYASDEAENNGLIDAFSSLSSGNAAVYEQTIQLESRGAKLNSNEQMNGTVIIDSTVGNDTSFLVTWTSQQPIFNLWDPSGHKHDNFVVNTQSNMATLQIPGTAEVGTWTYSFATSQAQTLSVTATSRAANPNVPPITVTSKMNKDTNIFPSPMIIYAEVHQGSLPVVGAKVTATVESQNGATVTLELLDNGAGADTTKDDGVYSRYFTAYKENGRYSLKVWAQGGNNVATQSFRQPNRALYIPGWVENGEIKMNPPKPEISEDEIQATKQSFSRTASGGSFMVSNVSSGPIPDVFPPNPITDLEANIEENYINLTWTAPGDDFDEGRAQQYIIRMSQDIITLRENFDTALQVNTTDLIPKDANSKEIFKFIPEEIIMENVTTVFLAIKAVDKANLTSSVSNIARVSLLIPSVDNPPSDPSNPSNGVNISTIVLSVFGAVAAVAFIVSVTVCVLKKKNK